VASADGRDNIMRASRQEMAVQGYIRYVAVNDSLGSEGSSYRSAERCAWLTANNLTDAVAVLPDPI